MRIERQAYIGKPALALYISDRTNKMHEKLSNMVQREEEQSNQQTENFTSTLSHEMRTPLLTILFFLQRIIAILSNVPIDLNKVPEAIKYCKIMNS